MKKLLLFTLLLLIVLPVSAQELADSTCGVGHVGPLVTEYFRTVTKDRNSDLSAAVTLYHSLGDLGCGGEESAAAPATTPEPGAVCNAGRADVVLLIMDYHSNESGKGFYNALGEQLNGCPDGTLGNPYPFNLIAVSLRVNIFIRPANLIAETEAPEGQMPVLVGVECTRDCKFTASDFTLVDAEGTSYDAVSLIDNYAERMQYDVAVAERDLFGIVFVIPEGSSELRLVYGDTVYYVEPGQEGGLVATSSEEIEIHSQPGTQFPVVGVLSPQSPQVVYGRNEVGTWVQTTAGWMETKGLKLDGDVMGLELTAPGQ